MIYLYLRLLFLWFLSNSCESNKVGGKESAWVNSQILTRNVILQSNLLIVGCGTIAYADGFRFTLGNSDSSFIGIVRCPDGYGENFFVKGAKYTVAITNNHITDSLKYYSLVNPYEKSNFPVYLITEIKKIR